VLSTALAARFFGISCIPIRADGTKRPGLKEWKTFQARLPSIQEELKTWFQPGLGIALVTGEISGGLEALDFDNRKAYEDFRAIVASIPSVNALFERIARGYIEMSPTGGVHLLYRCPSVEGNQKLASRKEGESVKTLIETRGEGGYIITFPSAGHVHPSAKPYVLLSGDVASIRKITCGEREALFAIARYLDEVPPKMPRMFDTLQRPASVADIWSNGQGRPGDIYNQIATWKDVLEPKGWRLVREEGDVGYWSRPGKESNGWNATTNFGGADRLYVFTTASDFEAERSYSKFEAFTILYHGGDYSSAAKVLKARGYTKKVPD
jgi:putative DNA primase/helicase